MVNRNSKKVSELICNALPKWRNIVKCVESHTKDEEKGFRWVRSRRRRKRRRRKSRSPGKKEEESGLGGCVGLSCFPQKKAEKLPNFTVLRQFRFVVSLVNPVPLPVVACPAEIGLWGLRRRRGREGKIRRRVEKIWGWKEEELLTRFDPA